MTDHERAAYYGDTGDLEGANEHHQEAQPEYLAFSELLDCGHRVEASEDSGGFDEVPRVTEKMVRDLLAFKVKTHDCERTEARIRRTTIGASDTSDARRTYCSARS